MSQYNAIRHQRGSVALNILAVALMLMPIVSFGMWLAPIVRGDPRDAKPLAVISKHSTPRVFEEPLVSVTFDDGWETVYSNAAPVMSQYGVVSTQFILPGQFADHNYLSVNQVKQLQDAGHQISSHTYSHKNLTLVSTAEAKQEIDRSLQILRKFNFVSGDRLDFAPPNGAINPRVMQEIRWRFASMRNVNGDLGNGVTADDVNTREAFDRYDIIGYSVSDKTTDAQFNETLDFAKKHNGWFVPVYHQVEGHLIGDNESYAVSKEAFERQMKMIRDSGIKTSTIGQAIASYKEAE